MKVALVESHKSEGHAGRGIGVYTENLKKYLPDWGIELVKVSQNPDLIHYPQWDYLSSDWRLLNSRTPVVLTIHDVIPLDFPEHYPLGLKTRLNLYFHRKYINKAGFVITDSYASVKSIRRHLGVADAKLRFIYLGADPEYKPVTAKKLLTETKKKYSLPEKFVLYVGDVNWNKNLVSLVKTCRDLKIDLVIAGKNAKLIDTWNLNHPELRHLQDLIPLLHGKYVHRLGFVNTPDLAVIMNLASVYCQPSFAEGFGLPVLEARKCGTPVVCSNLSSLPELSGPGVVYFDPYQKIDLGIKLSQVLKNPPAVDPDSAFRFNWAETARQTADIYHAV